MLISIVLLIGGFVTVPLLFVMLGWISLQLIYRRFIPAKRDEATRRLQTAGFPDWLRVWANISVASGVGLLMSIVSAIVTYDYREPLTLAYIRYLWDF